MAIPKEKQEKIIELFHKGYTQKQIMEELNICKNTCIKYLKEQGLTRKKSIEMTPELLDKIQARYDEVGNIKK